MFALALSALLSATQPGCGTEATALLARASARAAEFDLEGASQQLETDIAGRCEAAQIARLYVGGLIAAREAFRQGGPPELLEPVRQAITSLDAIAKGRPGPAAVARLVLQAASAAAQSERDEMGLYLDSAIHMESLQHTAGQPGAPLVSAAEAAGEFWLQLHGYEAARGAYSLAAAQKGFTMRVLAGLGRSAERLADMPGACAAFRQLLEAWGSRPAQPIPISDARAYLGGCPTANP
jgi:hypothetical protein